MGVEVNSAHRGDRDKNSMFQLQALPLENRHRHDFVIMLLNAQKFLLYIDQLFFKKCSKKEEKKGFRDQMGKLKLIQIK